MLEDENEKRNNSNEKHFADYAVTVTNLSKRISNSLIQFLRSFYWKAKYVRVISANRSRLFKWLIGINLVAFGFLTYQDVVVKKALLFLIFLNMIMIQIRYSLLLNDDVSRAQQGFKRKGNVSVKKVYYEIPLKLFWSLREVEKLLGVEILDRTSNYSNASEIRKIRIRTPETGQILDQKKATTQDILYQNYFFVPAANPSRHNVYVSVDGYITQDVTAYLDGDFEKIEKYVLANPLIAKKFDDLKDHLAELAIEEAEMKRQEVELEERKRQNEEDEMITNRLLEKGLSEKAIRIFKYLKAHNEELGMHPHDLFGRSMTFNKDFLKVRMDLNSGSTKAAIRKSLDRISAATGISPRLRNAENESSVYLIFVLGEVTKGRKLSMEQIKADAAEGILNVGRTFFGDYKVLMPREDQPTFALIGGLSRSGKSTFGTRLITSLLYLKDAAGNYDYHDVFIGSVKDEDYIANGFKAAGMHIAGSPEEVYQMLLYIDQIATARKEEFLEVEAINIKQFNRTSRKKMGKILVVLDEYANTISAAAGIKLADGMKLSEAIQNLARKIAQEHGSRGVSLIVITQAFNKTNVGTLFDALGSKFLGYAPKNVWDSIDNTQEMSRYLGDKEDDRQGLFFVNSPDFKVVEGVEADRFNSGYVEVRTHFIDTPDIRKGFDRHFSSAEAYEDSQETSLNASSLPADMEILED